MYKIWEFPGLGRPIYQQPLCSWFGRFGLNLRYTEEREREREVSIAEENVNSSCSFGREEEREREGERESLTHRRTRTLRPG